MKNKIAVRQLCIMLILYIPISKLLILPSLLSDYCGENLYLAAIFNFLLDAFAIFIILKLSERFDGDDFYTILTKTFGVAVAKIICFLFMLFFMFKALIPIMEQKNSVEFTLYDTQPEIIIYLPFFAVSAYICIKGLNPLARASEVALWIGGLGYIIIIFLSVGAGEYDRILPLFGGRGFDFIPAGFKNSIWFCDSSYILFLLGYFKKEKNYKRKIFLSFLLCSFLVVLFLIIFYCVFDSIAPKQFYALLRMSKYAISLSNIGRFDFIACFMLSMVSVFQISLTLLLASNLFKKIFSVENVYVAPLFVNGTVLIATYILGDRMSPLIYLSANYVCYFAVALTLFIPLITLCVATLKRRKL